jgi:Domain of unknown function (DUF5911)
VTPEEVSGAVTVPSTADVFPPHVLREYALIADGERGTLIGPRGDIVWMCAPRWHSGAVFAALIGGEGAYAVTPEDRFVWGGYYEPAPEYDVPQRQLRGNLPQAFVHALLLECSARLAGHSGAG